MNYYITWDLSGEYLWSATPYLNKTTLLWQTEHDTPDNKIRVCDNTLERYCWAAVNSPNPPNIYEITYKQAEELEYATTKILR